MMKHLRYNPLLEKNRDGLVRIVKISDHEKAFQEFDPTRLIDKEGCKNLMDLYANTLSTRISEHLDIKVSPFIRQTALIDGDLLKKGYFNLLLIKGGRNFWTKFEGDCILRSDIKIANNGFINNTVIFDSYEQDDEGDKLYDVVKNAADIFAGKTSLKHNHTYGCWGHPNPISVNICPMSYKLYYVSKNFRSKLDI